MEVKVKEWRTKRKMTIDELAKKSGISRSTIINCEKGHTQTIKLSTIIELAKGLNVDYRKLL